MLTSPISRVILMSPNVDLANKLLASSKILKSTMAPLTFFQMKREVILFQAVAIESDQSKVVSSGSSRPENLL